MPIARRHNKTKTRDNLELPRQALRRVILFRNPQTATQESETPPEVDREREKVKKNMEKAQLSLRAAFSPTWSLLQMVKCGAKGKNEKEGTVTFFM